MGTKDERFEIAQNLALELDSKLPTDVMLKGDGSIWITTYGNNGVPARKITQQEVLEIIYRARTITNKLISV